MSKLFFVALCAVLLFAFVQADSEANYLARHLHGPTPLTSDELCARIGELSGCSGCEHGTKNMCSWIAREADPVVTPGKRTLVFEDRAIMFQCVPTHKLADVFAQYPNDAELAGHICPADPKKEPMLRVYFNVPDADDFPPASTVYSQFYDSDLVDWGATPYAVDRTSFYGDIGYGRLGQKGLADDPILRRHINCAEVSSQDLIDVHDENWRALGEESNLLNGVLVTERDKRCARITLSQYLSSRCPAYGVAVSGICQSLYDAVLRECLILLPKSSIGALRATNALPSGLSLPSKAIEAYHVVPDGTPYCLKDFPLKPSGHYEALAGLNIPADRLREMYCAGQGFEYDCDEHPYSEEPCRRPWYNSYDSDLQKYTMCVFN